MNIDLINRLMMASLHNDKTVTLKTKDHEVTINYYPKALVNFDVEGKNNTNGKYLGVTYAESTDRALQLAKNEIGFNVREVINII